MKILNQIKSLEEVFWLNENHGNFQDVIDILPINYKDVLEAEERLERFAPFIKKAFPETENGIIESPILEINEMKKRMEKDF
ncbi:MAG: D-serine ammonia-lyase, partial [Tissierellia bacterium]|nr:D-serine ammonia-lyase [Tissierellia bacterium]